MQKVRNSNRQFNKFSQKEDFLEENYISHGNIRGNNNDPHPYIKDGFSKVCLLFTFNNLPGLWLYVSTKLIGAVKDVSEKIQQVAKNILIDTPTEIFKDDKQLFLTSLYTIAPTILGAASTYFLAGRSIYGLGVVIAGVSPTQGALVGLVGGVVARVVPIVLEKAFGFDERNHENARNIIGLIAGVAVSTLVLPGAAMTALWIDVAITISSVVGFLGLMCIDPAKSVAEDLADMAGKFYENFGEIVGGAFNKTTDVAWAAGIWTLSQGISLLPEAAAVALATCLFVGKALMGVVLIQAGLTVSAAVPMALIPVVVSRVLNSFLKAPKNMHNEEKIKNRKTFENAYGLLGRVVGVAGACLLYPTMLPTVLTLSAISLGVDYLKIGDRFFGLFSNDSNNLEKQDYSSSNSSFKNKNK